VRIGFSFLGYYLLTRKYIGVLSRVRRSGELESRTDSEISTGAGILFASREGVAEGGSRTGEQATRVISRTERCDRQAGVEDSW
jgi:hypothetical protein